VRQRTRQKATLPRGFRLESDRQPDGGRWRNLLVIGPGIKTPERKYWIEFDTFKDRFRETKCAGYLRRKDPTVMRRLGQYIRSSRPWSYQ
jgi:hypothetical protein